MTGLNAVAAIWCLLALPVLAAGLSGRDAVGRLGGEGIGRRIDARTGWFVIELLALATFPAIYLMSGNLHLVGNIALALWLAHYAHRTLLWPWLVQKADATVSLAMVAAGAGFNLLAGALLGWFMGYAADYVDAWLLDPRFIAGLGLMIGGAALNVWADYYVLHLRKTSSERRVMPEGGAFKVMACPNLAGEIIEWIGFALLTWSLPGVAFALWTIANLVPRAIWRRNWYRETFSGFAGTKAALVPGIL